MIYLIDNEDFWKISSSYVSDMNFSWFVKKKKLRFLIKNDL